MASKTSSARSRARRRAARASRPAPNAASLQIRRPAQEWVRQADEPIVLVAHEDRERALAAQSAVHVDVEPMPPALSVEDALARKALVYGDDNVFKEIVIARGDPDAALREADVI